MILLCVTAESVLWFINDEVADNVCTSNSTLLSLALALVAFSYLHRTQD